MNHLSVAGLKTLKLGKQTKTHRGFPMVEFKDYYSAPCTLQCSSIALCHVPGVSAIWLGIDDAQPQVMATQAASVGVETKETTGWVPYDKIPACVSLNTRMHLSRRQVAALMKHLDCWLRTGVFVEPKPVKAKKKGGR